MNKDGGIVLGGIALFILYALSKKADTSPISTYTAPPPPAAATPSPAAQEWSSGWEDGVPPGGDWSFISDW